MGNLTLAPLLSRGAYRFLTPEEQAALIEAFVRIGRQYHIAIRTCCENSALAQYGADVSGCMTREVLEAAIGCRLRIPKTKKSPRMQCNCLLGADIGMDNTCPHGCIYCYANANRKLVLENYRRHDPASPLLIGTLHPQDQIANAQQESYLDGQLSMF